MDFEQAKKQMALGYSVSRFKWKNEKCLFIAKGHLCERKTGEIERPSFEKTRLSFDDISANDWVSIVLKRKGKKISINNGYQDYNKCKLARILAKFGALSKGDKLT
jgi:hypothetical protein